MKRKIILSILSLISLSLYFELEAQERDSVRWMSFEQLEDSLARNPKKVFLDFQTDWCAYCRKMDKEVFTKTKVVEILNQNYYAVRFDAETESIVTFGGRTFLNDQIGNSRTPTHQIVQLFATRQGQFTAPTLVVLDEDFKLIGRYFEYMDSKKILEVLK